MQNVWMGRDKRYPYFKPTTAVVCMHTLSLGIFANDVAFTGPRTTKKENKLCVKRHKMLG